MKEYNDIYNELCDDIRKCSICKDVRFTPHSKDSNYLIHDVQLGSEKYENRWNLWQKNLNAEIMVIGQDFGTYDSSVNGVYDSPFTTDKTLCKLFRDVFSINELNSKNHIFYFTNVAKCYRKHQSTGSINKGCLFLCANKFMTRLIQIVLPKVIVTLGKDTFSALAYCDKAKLVCSNPTDQRSNTDDSLNTIMKYDYFLELDDGKKIAVFPVYHPGANGINRNRDYEQQKKDWNRIKEYLENKNER